MKLAKLILAASALALAGGVYAADKDKQARANPEPGFNNLDTNHDGFLTRAEARGDRSLSERFKEADTDNDGKLTRGEYLRVKGREDMNAVRERASNLAGRIGGGGESGEAAAGGSSPAKDKR